MIPRLKPTVGQKLFSLNVGNAARNCAQVLTPVTVVKVGKAYFYCKDPRAPEWSDPTTFHLDDWREKSNYAPNEQLYESEQAWLDEQEANKLANYIGNFFRYYTASRVLTLQQLRDIAAILPKPKEG